MKGKISGTWIVLAGLLQLFVCSAVFAGEIMLLKPPAQLPGKTLEREKGGAVLSFPPPEIRSVRPRKLELVAGHGPVELIVKGKNLHFAGAVEVFRRGKSAERVKAAWRTGGERVRVLKLTAGRGAKPGRYQLRISAGERVYLLPVQLTVEEEGPMLFAGAPMAPAPEVAAEEKQVADSAAITWIRIAAEAKKATREGVRGWVSQVMVTKGLIQVSRVTISPGGLNEPAFEALVVVRMTTAGVDPDIAGAFAKGVWQGWREWARGFTISQEGVFPQFANWPGQFAQSRSQRPIMLSASRAGRHHLSRSLVSAKVLAKLGRHAGEPGAEKAVNAFAGWLETQFNDWLDDATLVDLLGQGTVPSYAPPFVLSGPVVSGELIPMPGNFAGPPFAP
jgi:predicted aconitase with swiveling domain